MSLNKNKPFIFHDVHSHSELPVMTSKQKIMHAHINLVEVELQTKKTICAITKLGAILIRRHERISSDFVGMRPLSCYTVDCSVFIIVAIKINTKSPQFSYCLPKSCPAVSSINSRPSSSWFPPVQPEIKHAKM